MANDILEEISNMNTKTRYQLPLEARQKILAQTPIAQLNQRVEQERRNFIRMHGDAFGSQSPVEK